VRAQDDLLDNSVTSFQLTVQTVLNCVRPFTFC
jgi:hypothetical protein